MFDERSFEDAAGTPLADGMTAYSSDGDRLGTVRGYDPHLGYLDVRKGWLLHRDLFVPVACVEYVEEGDIVLAKAELEDPRFHAPLASDHPRCGGKARRMRRLPALEHEIARARALLHRHHRPHPAN